MQQVAQRLLASLLSRQTPHTGASAASWPSQQQQQQQQQQGGEADHQQLWSSLEQQQPQLLSAFQPFQGPAPALAQPAAGASLSQLQALLHSLQAAQAVQANAAAGAPQEEFPRLAGNPGAAGGQGGVAAYQQAGAQGRGGTELLAQLLFARQAPPGVAHPSPPLAQEGPQPPPEG